MNTVLMNKLQCCGADAVGCIDSAAVPIRRPFWRPGASVWAVARQLGVAAAVAAALGLLVALVATTPSAVEAIALPPLKATVELPRVVIQGQRLTAGACPLPTEFAAAACPVLVIDQP